MADALMKVLRRMEAKQDRILAGQAALKQQLGTLLQVLAEEQEDEPAVVSLDDGRRVGLARDMSKGLG